MISKLKYEYLLLFIATAWILLFSFAIQLQPGFSNWGDDSTYLFAAKELYYKGMADVTRPVFVSAVIGLPFLFGCSAAVVVKWGILINFSCWFATLLLVFKIVADRTNRATAFLAATAFVVCLGNLAVSFHLIAEALFVFLWVLVLYGLQLFLRTNNYRVLTLVMAFSILMVVVKPLPIGLVLLLVLYYGKSIKELWGNRYVVVLLMSLSLLFFQMYSLKKHYGDFTVSYIGSITYYNYLGARADCLKQHSEYIPGENPRTKHFNTLSVHQMKAAATADMKDQLVNNTGNLMKAYGTNIYLNSTKGNSIIHAADNTKQTAYFDVWHWLFMALSKMQNIVVTGIAVFLSLYSLLTRKRQDAFKVVLSVSILYVFLISGISSNEGDRFHLVFFPIAIILAADIWKHYSPKTVCK